MTGNDFREWFRHHTAAFPDVGDWFGKLPITPPEGVASRSDTADAWQQTLVSISLEAAKGATDALHAGHAKLPYRVSQHPAEVAKLARSYAANQTDSSPMPRYHDGEQAYRCTLCEDTGWVLIWSRKTLKIAAGKVKDTTLDTQGAIRSVVAACTCKAGEMKHQLCGRFDPERDLPLEAPWRLMDPETIEAMKQFAVKATAPQRHDEFEDFA